MTTQLHDTGEEFVQDYVFTGGATKPSNVQIGLFNDSTDALTDSNDIGDITTEPTGTAYARQNVSFDGTGFGTADASGDWEATTANTVTFDTSDSSQTVDSYFVVINFDSDDAGDGGTPADHLFWTGSLSQSRDLSQIDTLNVDNIGISVT